MKAFAELYTALDASTSTLDKLEALERYLRSAVPADAAWATYFLAGGKPRQTVPSRLLREAAREAAGVPPWLFDECYLAVGDLAETIAHLLPPAEQTEDTGLHAWMVDRLLPLRGAPPEAVKQALRDGWSGLDWNGRFVLGKLITGGLRVGVSKLLVVRALARVAGPGVDAALVAQRMIGYTDAKHTPDAARWLALVAPAAQAGRPEAGPDGRPYPFFLAHPLQQPPETLGGADDWLVEWKWDGIRAQLVIRGARAWLWSRGEELVTERFPEVERAALVWASAVAPGGEGVVLDGELLAWQADASGPMPFVVLQTRVTRRAVGPAVLRTAPVVFLAYDLLEWRGEDWRSRPQRERRARLEALIAVPADAVKDPSGRLRLSPRVQAADWPALAALRAESRARGVEGLMLKRLGAPYGIGRTRADGGDWWKWKVDPFTVDAVLVYAQRGHGRRASLYSDYTFAVWDRESHSARDTGESDTMDEPGNADQSGPVPRTLLPFAKAYSGLTDAEMRQVDAVVRRTTIEAFGPVRSVTPTLVFEIGFEGIARSPRHKSGIAVRFPRMLRWRTDKTPAEADTIAALRAMLGEPPL